MFPQKQKASHFMQNYMEAFIRNDIAILNELLHFPLAQPGERSVTLLDEIPIKPSDFRDKMEWAKTNAFEYDIVAASHIEAHIQIRNEIQLRSAGSLIEEVSVLYDPCKISEVRKILARSGILFPA